MKLLLNKKNLYSLIIFINTGWLIICSGSQYFRNFNSLPTHVFLIFISIMTFLIYKKISKKNIAVCICILCILLFHALVTYRDKIDNNMFIFVITIFVLFIFCSNINIADYKKMYIYFMIAEVLLSLVCFLVCWFGKMNTLPGYDEVIVRYSGGYNIIYLTPYYTIGWLSTGGFFYRNAGIFWEPGAHAIYIDLALLFLLDATDLKKSTTHRKLEIVILILGILTTLSTTGYIVLTLSFLYYATKSKKRKDVKRNILVIIVTFMFLIITALYGDVFDKIIYRQGSFGTRYTDTVEGAKLVLSNWLFGKGMFNNISDALKKVGINNISNGFIELMIRLGIPLTMTYALMFHKGIKRMFGAKELGIFILDIIFLIYLNSESISTFPVIMIFFFFFRQEKDNASSKLLQYGRSN
mgnify:CR=1 FL=1